MIQSSPMLTLDPTALLIMAAVLILVVSLHLYLQRVINKRARAEPRMNVKP